jgi:hypothetical protein
MSKRQDLRDSIHPDAPGSANSAKQGKRGRDDAWPPVFHALRREFRDNLARVAAGNDPVARLLGYRNLLKLRYGTELPAPAAEAEEETPAGDAPARRRKGGGHARR